MSSKKYLMFVLLILLAVGCSKKISQSEINKVVVSRYYEGINHGRLEIAEEIIDDNFIKYNNKNRSDKMGPVVLREAIQSHIDNNSEYKFIVEDIVAEDNKVAVRWEWESINIKTGIPKPVTTRGISIFNIKNGKITELHQSFDMLDFNEQIND